MSHCGTSTRDRNWLTCLPVGSDLQAVRADGFSGVVGALAFSPDGKYVVAGFGFSHIAPLALYVTPR